VLRRKQLEVVPLTAVDAVPADVVRADHRFERDQQIAFVFSAIADLPRTLLEDRRIANSKFSTLPAATAPPVGSIPVT
jgi:hypothetical protein